MKYYFAPLEGITGYIYRNAHARFFPGVDKYFAPFISTNQNHRLSNREMRDILPGNNEGVVLVPQLLGKSAPDFIAAARVLKDMGYNEVNLNLGCPSGTVVAKGKGAGALAHLDALDRFLGDIYSQCDISISIKTRLGVKDAGEFERILEIYNSYPVCELTIHPRVQKDFYKNPVRRGAFRKALSDCRVPVCYNGDLETEADIEDFEEKFPSVGAVMIGRGLVSDPSLVARLRGGRRAAAEAVRSFHDEVYSGYSDVFGSGHSAMMRMKELWSYMLGLFEDGGDYGKRIKKSKTPQEYEAAVQALFRDLKLKGVP